MFDLAAELPRLLPATKWATAATHPLERLQGRANLDLWMEEGDCGVEVTAMQCVV